MKNPAVARYRVPAPARVVECETHSTLHGAAYSAGAAIVGCNTAGKPGAGQCGVFWPTGSTTTSLPFWAKRMRVVFEPGLVWTETRVIERPGVRVAPLVRYPYNVFYRVIADAVEILHIHHTSRRAPWEDQYT